MDCQGWANILPIRAGSRCGDGEGDSGGEWAGYRKHNRICKRVGDNCLGERGKARFLNNDTSLFGFKDIEIQGHRHWCWE